MRNTAATPLGRRAARGAPLLLAEGDVGKEPRKDWFSRTVSSFFGSLGCSRCYQEWTFAKLIHSHPQPQTSPQVAAAVVIKSGHFPSSSLILSQAVFIFKLIIL
ncbi:hypothetical protein Hdeb2414_s0006g00224841 [Helianthus debilis subsp. tardiflorus]